MIDGNCFLMGRTSGGDGGGLWGSVWFAYWRRPLDLFFLYEKHWDMPDWFGGLDVAMDSQLDEKNLVAIVSVRQMGEGTARYSDLTAPGTMVTADTLFSGATAWKTVDADTVFLADLIAKQ